MFLIDIYLISYLSKVVLMWFFYNYNMTMTNSLMKILSTINQNITLEVHVGTAYSKNYITYKTMKPLNKGRLEIKCT